MSDAQDVVFYCWRCGQKLAVPDRIQGKTLPCPKCQRPLIVPTGDGVLKRDIPPPAPAVDELAVTENDMSFDCMHCNYLLIMDKRGAGMTVPCPGCGKMITVPQPKEAPQPKHDVETLTPASGDQAVQKSLAEGLRGSFGFRPRP